MNGTASEPGCEFLRYVAADLPRILWIELTSQCPFRCIFCSRRLRRGHGEDLDFDLYRSLMNELRCPEIVRLNYSGESIHYPHLSEAIELAKATGAKTELVSALASASDSVLRSLIHAGLDRLTISLHAATAEGFDRIYGFSSFPDLCERVAKLMQWKQELGSALPRLDLAFVATESTLSELPLVAAYARAWGISEISVLPVVRRDPIAPEFTEELESGRLRESFKRKIREAVALAQHNRHGLDIRLRIAGEDADVSDRLGHLPRHFPAKLPANARIHTCEQNPWDTVHILADGSVVVCEVQDHVSLGNLHRHTLREIWHGDEYTSFRKRYYAGDIPACAECPDKVACVPMPLRSGIASTDDPGLQLFRGWYERDSTRTRWSGREAVVLLGGHRSATGVRIGGLLPPDLTGGGNFLEICCADRVLGKIANPTETAMHFHACFGGVRPGAGPHAFVLRTHSAYNPARAGMNQDRRDLGFALFSMELVDL